MFLIDLLNTIAFCSYSYCVSLFSKFWSFTVFVAGWVCYEASVFAMLRSNFCPWNNKNELNGLYQLKQHQILSRSVLLTDITLHTVLTVTETYCACLLWVINHKTNYERVCSIIYHQMHFNFILPGHGWLIQLYYAYTHSYTDILFLMLFYLYICKYVLCVCSIKGAKSFTSLCNPCVIKWINLEPKVSF